MASEVEESEGNRGEQAARISKTTIFVRNLPYNITDAEFKNAFEDVGPIKRCFIVKDKDNKSRCRGFGYVTFALEEDAQKAKENVKMLKGRSVAITFSAKKPRAKLRKGSLKVLEDKDETELAHEEGKSVENESGKHETNQIVPSQKDHQKSKSKSLRRDAQSDAGRTVVLTGLPTSVTDKQIYKRCRKLGEVEKTTFPVEGRDGPTAAVLFKSYKDSRLAVAKLNGKMFKGSTLKAIIETREKITPVNKANKKSRLIVRNLSFKCSEAILEETFGSFGEIVEVNIPVKKVQNRNRKLGFGFVQFSNVFDAAKALEGMNSKEILGRPIAVDWAVSREKFKAMADNDSLDEPKQKRPADGEATDESDADNEDDNTEGLVESNADSKDEAENDDDDDDSNSQADDDDDDEEDEDHQQKKPSDVKEGLTIFIRNLSYDSSEKTVSNLFRKFGNLSYCKIVMDPVTQHSKGSAFVKFKSTESVTSCLASAADDGGGLKLDGNQLRVDLAVTRGKLEHLHQQKEQERKEPRDKRNLYLAREGVILPGSDASKELSKADLLRRQKAEADKKVKLKNPNYFVSKTRLCVRNLPLKINEKELSNVFSQAASSECSKHAVVKSVLLMRNKERVDSSGKGRPLGFGFVEFTNHNDALAALRAMNNNPSIFGPDRRPIVEFSIENSTALKSKQQRVQRNVRKQKQMAPQTEDPSKTNKEKRMERKERRIEIRKAKRLRKKERKLNPDVTDEKKIEKVKPKDFSKNVKSRPKQFAAKPEKRTFKTKRTKELDLDRPRMWSGDVVGGPGKKGQSAEKEEKVFRQKAKRKAREMKEEKEFTSIVQNYKNKLFGGSDVALKKKRARWFE